MHIKPRQTGEYTMHRHTIIGAFVLAIFLATLSSGLSYAQEPNPEFGPGLDLIVPDEHNIFLHGPPENAELRRDWPIITGIPLGSIEFSKTTGVPNQLIQIDGSPLKEALLFDGTVSVNLFASLEAKSPICRQTNGLPGTPAGATTQFFVTLTWGSFTLLDNFPTEAITMDESYALAHQFSISSPVSNISMGPGDVMSISISVEHDCIQQGVLWWGTFDARSGITLEGDILDPQLDQVLDSNRMSRIEFTPISPWGDEDFSAQVIEVVGPMSDWSSMIHGFGQEDQRLEHFESPHAFRIGEANRTIRTWSTSNPLEPGLYMVDACFTLVDQHPGDQCDIIAVLKFEVPEDPDAILSGTWVAILIPLGVIGWLGMSIREAMLPLPAYIVILVLAIASIGPAVHLPDIDSNEARLDGAAPSFTLLQHGGDGSVSLGDLLSESDAVVVGMYVPGSANAVRQANDFQMAEILMDEDVAFVQIATGEGVRAVDLDSHADYLNESWPLLMDMSDSRVGRAFPSGASDSVIIIDAGGFVTDWSPGTLSSTEIAEAVESSMKGSGHSFADPILMLWGTALLPLFVLSMPRERRYEEPNDILLPGSGVLLTLLAAGSGFLIWALPIAIFAAIGMGVIWIWIEVLLASILIYHGIRTLTSGCIPELKWISNRIHSYLPESYSEWRNANSFSDDLHLGIWVAWLIWLRTPDLVAQGVGSVARTGILGILLAIAVLLGMTLAAGLSVTVCRLIIGITGPIPRTMGSLSVGIRPRAWGLASSMLGGWLLISLILGPVIGSF